MFKKILRFLIRVLFVSFLIILAGNQGLLNLKIDLLNKSTDARFDLVSNQNSILLDNQTILERDLQETLNLLKSFVMTVGNNTQELKQAIEQKNTDTLNKFYDELDKYKEPDLKKLLNGSVFVQGIMGLGAGTVIKKTDNEMYILTCNHVVDDIIQVNELGMKMYATVGYSRQDRVDKLSGLILYKAEIIKYDKDNDMALLKMFVVDDKLEVIPIAKAEPNKGDLVYSVGNPLGLLRTISKGILANKQDGFYLSDNTTTYGNSGGGLFNQRGELIGIPSNVTGYEHGGHTDNSIAFAPETSLGLSISLFRIKAFLQDTGMLEE